MRAWRAAPGPGHARRRSWCFYRSERKDFTRAKKGSGGGCDVEGPCRKVPARRCGRARSTRDLEPVFETSPDDGKLSSDRLGCVSSPAVLVVVVFDKTDVLVIGDFRGSESSLGISARFQPRQSLYFFQRHVAFGFIGGCGSGFPVVDCNFFLVFLELWHRRSNEAVPSIGRRTRAPSPIARRCGHSFAVQRWPSS